MIAAETRKRRGDEIETGHTQSDQVRLLGLASLGLDIQDSMARLLHCNISIPLLFAQSLLLCLETYR